MKFTFICKNCQVTSESTKLFKVFIDTERVRENKKIEREKRIAENEFKRKKMAYEFTLEKLKMNMKSRVEDHRFYESRGLFSLCYQLVRRSDDELEDYIRDTDWDLYYSVYEDDFQLRIEARKMSGFNGSDLYASSKNKKPERYIQCPVCTAKNYTID